MIKINNNKIIYKLIYVFKRDHGKIQKNILSKKSIF